MHLQKASWAISFPKKTTHCRPAPGSQDDSRQNRHVVDASMIMPRTSYDHVDLLVANPVLEFGRELQFVGQRGELGALRLNVEINVATVPGIVSPGSEKANDRVLTETLLRQGYDLRTFRIRQPHALTHLVDDRNVGS
jgi:hypothetical protein